jgi:HK97 family phage portal protein
MFIDRWLDKTIGKLGYIKAASVPVQAAFGGEAPIANSMGYDNFSNEEREKLALTSSWVYSDIREITSLATSSDLGVYEVDGEGLTAVDNHEFEQIMVQPNERMDGEWMQQYTLMWWLLRGEAYWWKILDKSGQLSQLWPVPSTRMEPIPDKKAYISGFWYKPKHGQPPIRLDVSQVVYFRFPNLFDYHRGMSPISAYRLAMETDHAAQTWNRETFTNEVTLRTLLSIPAELSRPLQEQAKEQIREQLLDQRKRFMIAAAGDIKAEQLSMSPKDLEFLAGRDFSRKEIDRVYGFPEGYWSEKANRANAEAAKASLIEGSVWPLLKLMHGAITAQIIIPHYGENFRAQFDDIRPRNRELELQERGTYWNVKTVNEAREELDLEPIEDEELGETLVPLALRKGVSSLPKVGTKQGFGNEPPQEATEQEGEDQPEMPEDEDETGEDEAVTKAATEAAAKADLKKWEGIARRRLKNGESPAYDFESGTILPEVKADILEALQSAETEEEVKAAFAAPFCLDWEGYP